MYKAPTSFIKSDEISINTCYRHPAFATQWHLSHKPLKEMEGNEIKRKLLLLDYYNANSYKTVNIIANAAVCRLLRSLPICTLHMICIFEMCGPGSCILDKASELAAHHTHLQEILKGLQDQWNEGAENLYCIFITKFCYCLVDFFPNLSLAFLVISHRISSQ